MKHVLEFTYDGCDRWALNGGYVMTPLAVQEYIGREAFFEALKRGNSFRALLEITIENIKN